MPSNFRRNLRQQQQQQPQLRCLLPACSTRCPQPRRHWLGQPQQKLRQLLGMRGAVRPGCSAH